MKKKIFAILLVVFVLVAVVGCSYKNDSMAAIVKQVDKKLKM